MNDLHAAIAAYLRRHNPRLLTPCPAPGPPLDVARCRRCRALITAEGELFAIAVLVAARRCLGCYLKEAA